MSRGRSGWGVRGTTLPGIHDGRHSAAVASVTGMPQDAVTSEPAVSRERSSHRPQAIGGARIREAVSSHRGYQRIPAPRLRAIDARSVTARVKRARFAFTIALLEMNSTAAPDRQPGGLALRARSLALRPRLATGLPWTDRSRGPDVGRGSDGSPGPRQDYRKGVLPGP
jgi:hypothetical protein